MTQTIEPQEPAAPRGRPGGPVTCRDTGRTFATTAEAVAWLNGQGRPATVGGLANAASDNSGYKGYRWRRPPRPPGAGKFGPLKAPQGRPSAVPDAAGEADAGRVVVVPHTSVCCPDTGECWGDPFAAAAAMQAMGWRSVTATQIVAAIRSSDELALRLWDWRARAVGFCGARDSSGEPCRECSGRTAESGVRSDGPGT